MTDGLDFDVIESATTVYLIVIGVASLAVHIRLAEVSEVSASVALEPL